MRLVEFTIDLLEAQAESMKRLAALLGEERLIRLLEVAADAPASAPPAPAATAALEDAFDLTWLQPFNETQDPGVYPEIAGAVRASGLSETLEFYLWSFGPYRNIVESPASLRAEIVPATLSPMIDRCLQGAQQWFTSLALPEPITDQARRAAEVPWLRFRATVLKRAGIRPLGAV